MSQPTVLLSPLVQGVAKEGGTLDIIVRLQAPDQPAGKIVQTPKRLAVVVDRSGSMDGQPLKEALRCAMHIAEHLSPCDQVSLVLYDDNINVLAPLAQPAALLALRLSVEAIESGGSTDLFAGWEAGVKQLEYGPESHISRVILLSDGQANRGVVSVEKITSHVTAWASKGVTTTTVGLGRGFNEDLMIGMAHAGGGQQYYGQSAEDLFDSFDEELSLLQSLYARQPVIKFIPAPGVVVEILSHVKANADGTYALGDLAWGAETWMAVRLHTSADGSGLTDRDLLAVTASGKGLDGSLISATSGVYQIPLIGAEALKQLTADPMVARRLTEAAFGKESAELVAAIRRGHIDNAKALLDDLQARYSHHPWLADKIAVLQRLATHDIEMMAKEASYSSLKFGVGMVAKDEQAYTGDETNKDMPAFLRKKASIGRGRRH